MKMMGDLPLPFIGRVRFGEHSASGKLLGAVDFETGNLGAWELVGPRDSVFSFH